MPITTDAEVLAYVGSAVGSVPAWAQALVGPLRTAVEKAVKNYLGFAVEQATYTEYHPAKTLNSRYDGDNTSAGFDLQNGRVVHRDTFPAQRRELVLTQLPVRSIQAVYENAAAWNAPGGAWPATSLLPAGAYYLDDPGSELCWSGVVYRNTGAWAASPRTIRVDYTAGLTAAELAVAYPEFGMAVKVGCAKAIADAVARARTVAFGGTATNVGIEDFSAGIGPGNTGMIGSFLGAGVNTAALPTESMQWVARYVNVASYF